MVMTIHRDKPYGMTLNRELGEKMSLSESMFTQKGRSKFFDFRKFRGREEERRTTSIHKKEPIRKTWILELICESCILTYNL